MLREKILAWGFRDGLSGVVVKRKENYTLRAIHSIINRCAYRASEQNRPRRYEGEPPIETVGGRRTFAVRRSDKPRSNAGMQSYDALYKFRKSLQR